MTQWHGLVTNGATGMAQWKLERGSVTRSSFTGQKALWKYGWLRVTDLKFIAFFFYYMAY